MGRIKRAFRARLPLTPGRWLLLAFLIAVVMAFIGWLDTVTGAEPDLTILYLVPVGAATYVFGLWKGIAVSLVGALAEILAHPVMPGAGEGGTVTDALMHLAVFMVAAFAADALLRQLDAVRALEARRDMDLEIARSVHESFLGEHASSRPDLAVGVRLGFAFELGGDYYHVSDTPAGLFMSIGDISGKGVAAALFTVTLHEEMLSALDDDPRPESVVRSVNARLYSVTPPQTFVTLFCALIDGDSVTYVNAGHEPPLLLVPDAAAPTPLAYAPTMPLAVQPHLVTMPARAPFPPGSLLLAVTDGVTESSSLGEEPREELARLLVRDRALPVQTLADDVFAAAAPLSQEGQRDDITVLCVRKEPLAASRVMPAERVSAASRG